MSNLMTGAKMLLECLAREGVEVMFGYPGGVTLPFYDALYDNPSGTYWYGTKRMPRLPLRATRKRPARSAYAAPPRVPARRILSPGWWTRMMDSAPIVALTGQVSSSLIGSDAFQEADTFGITRSATKHNYMVRTLAELPQIIHEAFYLAGIGPPGPVLVDIPKDIFMARGHYEPVTEIHLPGYKVFTEGHSGQIRRAAQMFWEAERPLVYAGGGVLLGKAHKELREFVERHGCSCRLHADGAWRTSRIAPELHQHAWHARQLRRQHGDVQHRSAHRAGRSFR